MVRPSTACAIQFSSARITPSGTPADGVVPRSAGALVRCVSHERIRAP